MSVELDFLIHRMPGVPPKGLWLCHENMYVGTTYNAFVKSCDTDALPKQVIPEPICCHFDRIKDGPNESEYCYGKQGESNYGGPLYWTCAKDILNLARMHVEDIKDNTRIQAALAYLKVLADKDPDWRVVLWWH